MIDSKNNNDQNYEEVYVKDFESKSLDHGISYIENYFQRKLETISDKDIYNALKYAAQHGKNNHGHLAFVRNLLSGDLSYRTTKDIRKEIFLIAAQTDAKENPSIF